LPHAYSMLWACYNAYFAHCCLINSQSYMHHFQPASTASHLMFASLWLSKTVAFAFPYWSFTK
jgi:hypothetical protein